MRDNETVGSPLLGLLAFRSYCPYYYSLVCSPRTIETGIAIIKSSLPEKRKELAAGAKRASDTEKGENASLGRTSLIDEATARFKRHGFSP